MQAESHSIPSDDGVKLHVVVEGPNGAPTVMLSNSLGTDHTMWDGLAKHLSGQVRLIRYDTRGHGQSSPPPYAETTIARLGRDVVNILDHLDVTRVRFCGLSIGGMTGLWLGANVGDRFSCLALSNTGAYVGMTDIWNGRIKTVMSGGMAAITEATLERWFTADFLEAGGTEVDKVRKMLLGTSVAGYCACSAAVRDLDERPGLASIALPTLVITGAEDPATPPALGEEIAEGIPGARLVSIGGAAHLSNIEKPDVFNSAVGGFLLGNGQQ